MKVKGERLESLTEIVLKYVVGRWRTGGGGGRLVVQLGEQRVSEAEKASVLFCFHIFISLFSLELGWKFLFHFGCV